MNTTQQGKQLTASDRYLELLKRVVTGNIYAPEPDHDNEDVMQFVEEFKQHYFDNHAHSMVPLKRLDHLQACVVDIVRREVPGDLIEAGVWRGGTSIFMKAVLEMEGARERRVWVADSFEGLPQVDPLLHPKEARAMEGKTIKQDYRNFAASLEEVKHNFSTYGLLDPQVHFVQGWFKDTLHGVPADQFAIVRLDGDLYDSTIDALTALYPRLSAGGYLIIDDYADDLWTECRRAVDEYRREQQIQDPLRSVDCKCAYWQRSR
jgi:Macrocin-O-methyltransferase (TylF)